MAPVGYLCQALRGHGLRVSDHLANCLYPAVRRCVLRIISPFMSSYEHNLVSSDVSRAELAPGMQVNTV